MVRPGSGDCFPGPRHSCPTFAALSAARRSAQGWPASIGDRSVMLGANEQHAPTGVSMTSAPPSTAALAAVPHFAGVSPDVLDDLARVSSVRAFTKDTQLCRQGEPGNALFVLESGQVRAVRVMASGREVVLATIDAPAAFGELSLIDGAPRSATVLANRRCCVRVVPRAIYLEVLDRHPEAREALMRTLVAMIRQGNERHADTLGLDATARTAKWLLARAPASPPTEPRLVLLGRTQTALAAELGITRVRLNQVLKALEAAGLIAITGERMQLLDEPGLVSLCQ